MRYGLQISLLVWALPVCVCGCRGLGYVGYLVSPQGPMQTVEAEFDGLAAHSVAVVVYCDQKVLYEHPWAASEVSYAIGAELRERVKHITVLDPNRVLRYQGENVRWETVDKTRMGKELDVDFILYVTLMEFTTRQPGSLHLYQGRIAAEASVWDVSLPERQARVWYGSGFAAVYPQTPVGKLDQDDGEIRIATEQLFADELVKRFYKHKVPKEP